MHGDVPEPERDLERDTQTQEGINQAMQTRAELMLLVLSPRISDICNSKKGRLFPAETACGGFPAFTPGSCWMLSPAGRMLAGCGKTRAPCRNHDHLKEATLNAVNAVTLLQF